MIVIGRFRENYKDDKYPSILDFIKDTESSKKDKIFEYFNKSKISAVSTSYVYDEIGKIQTNIPLVMKTDGEYAWRSDLEYYYDKYNIGLPQKFIEKVIG